MSKVEEPRASQDKIQGRWKQHLSRSRAVKEKYGHSCNFAVAQLLNQGLKTAVFSCVLPERCLAGITEESSDPAHILKEISDIRVIHILNKLAIIQQELPGLTVLLSRREVWAAFNLALRVTTGGCRYSGFNKV